MTDKTYLVNLRLAVQHVVASTVEIHDEHLVFCDFEGKLVAMFLLQIVESWSVVGVRNRA